MDHVKNQQRLHAVVGETLPRFRERDITQAARVPEKTAVVLGHAWRRIRDLEIRNQKERNGHKAQVTVISHSIFGTTLQPKEAHWRAPYVIMPIG